MLSPCLRAAAAPPGCLPCALDIAAASWLLCSALSSLRLTGVPSGNRTKPPLPSGASPSGSPDSGPSPPSRLASFPMIDPSRSPPPPPLLLCTDQCAIRVLSAFLCPPSALKTAFLGVSGHLRSFALTSGVVCSVPAPPQPFPVVPPCFSVSRISAAVHHCYHSFSVRGVSVSPTLTVTEGGFRELLQSKTLN